MLFADLTTEERNLVEKTGHSRTFASGQAIIKEGEENRSLFVVQSGAVEVRKAISATKYKRLKELGKGEFFGDMAFLGISGRSATVVALKDCKVLELSSDGLDSLVKKRPDIALKVYRNVACELAKRLKQNTDELKEAVLWAIQGMEV